MNIWTHLNDSKNRSYHYKNTFHSSLIEEEISEIDYIHAERVFNNFDMANLEDYHNFYLLTEVLSLGNVFKNFRDVCLQHYSLDPAHNSSKRNSYIMCLDANNLYGWAMYQPLPTSNFKWLTNEKKEELDVMMIPDNSSMGYILECDLGKYFFYFLYFHVYFIKCSVSFLYISEYPLDFTNCNVSFLCI